MAEERIDVEVNDKVAPSISKKLRDIGSSADKSASAVDRLKAALASVNGSSAARLKTETDGAANSLAREAEAQNKVKMTADSAAAALAKEAAAQERVSKMIDRSIARYEAQRAAASASAVAQRAASRAIELTAANPSVILTPGGGATRGAAVAAEAATASAGVAAAARTTETAVADMEASTVSRFTRFKLAALGAFDSVRDGLTRNGTRFRGGILGAGGAAAVEAEAGAVTRLGHAAALNSTAIRELFVIAREGGRGDFTRMAGSVSILAGALGLMNTVLIPVALTLGTLAAGIKIFQMSIRSEANPQLKAYADSLGLTHKEMRKLANETVGAEGKLKEFNATQLTMADTFHGFIATVREGLAGLGDDANTAFQSMGVNWASVWDGALSFLKDVFVGFYGLVHGLTAWIIGTIGNVVKIIQNVFIVTANVVGLTIEGIVNTVIGGINLLSSGANAVMSALGFKKVIPQINEFKSGIKGITDNMKTLSGVDVGQNTIDSMGDADKTLTAFDKKWRKNSIDAGKERIKAIRDAIVANRNPPKLHDPKTKEDFIGDTNKRLDDELSRMHMLKDARDEQLRLDRVEEEFAKRRTPLTAAEIAGFKAKIHAIEQYKFVQAELDRIYDDAVGPLRDYNATLEAANDLYKRGAISAARLALETGNATRKLAETKDLVGANAALREYESMLDKIKFSLSEGGITQEQATEATNKATRAYQQATDPLFTMKEAIDQAKTVSMAYGVEAERAAYLQSIINAMTEQGKSAYDASTGALKAEVTALIAKNDALRQQQFIQDQVGSVLNPILSDQDQVASQSAIYAELERLRQGDLINEDAYQRAKRAMWVKTNEQRLSATSDFFGALADLTKHGHGVIGAISKAAAIAQATIDGFVAVQKALASAPPPFNFIAAAAVAIKTGANVAGILSTSAGSFATGGQFMVEGRSGVDANNINMNVTRGERVTIETPQQQRANDNDRGPGSMQLHTKVVNILDPTMIHDALRSDEGESIVMNIIAKNPTRVNGMLGNSRQ